jgi:hypothetical protein
MAEAVDQRMASVMRRKWTMLTLRRLEAMREALGGEVGRRYREKNSAGGGGFCSAAMGFQIY